MPFLTVTDYTLLLCRRGGDHLTPRVEGGGTFWEAVGFESLPGNILSVVCHKQN